MMFKKLSQRAQTYVNELLRSGMGSTNYGWQYKKQKKNWRRYEKRRNAIKSRGDCWS